MKKIIEAINNYYMKKLYLLDSNKLTVIHRLRRQESIHDILALLEFEFNRPTVAQTAFETDDISKKINENFRCYLSIVDRNKPDVVALIYTDMKMYDIINKLRFNKDDDPSPSTSSLSPAEIFENLYDSLESEINAGITKKKKNRFLCF